MSQNCSHLSKGAVNLEKAPDVWELREGYKTHLGFRRYDQAGQFYQQRAAWA